MSVEDLAKERERIAKVVKSLAGRPGVARMRYRLYDVTHRLLAAEEAGE